MSANKNFKQGQPEAGVDKLFLDCEYNGFGGPLISMALVTEDGREFYEVLPCEDPESWVAQHVMPNLNKPAVASMAEFQKRLSAVRQHPCSRRLARGHRALLRVAHHWTWMEN
jgi:hypothetical protein